MQCVYVDSEQCLRGDIKNQNVVRVSCVSHCALHNLHYC